jgi:hypothetical protein
MGSCTSKSTASDPAMDAWAKEMDTSMKVLSTTATLPVIPGGRGSRVKHLACETAIKNLEVTAVRGATTAAQRVKDALKAFGRTTAHQVQVLDILTGSRPSEDPVNPEVAAVMQNAANASLPNFPHVNAGHGR